MEDRKIVWKYFVEDLEHFDKSNIEGRPLLTRCVYLVERLTSLFASCHVCLGYGDMSVFTSDLAYPPSPCYNCGGTGVEASEKAWKMIEEEGWCSGGFPQRDLATYLFGGKSDD